MKKYVLASPVGIFVQRAPKTSLNAYGVYYTADIKEAMSFEDEESTKRFADDWKIPKIMRPAKRA